MAKLPEPDRSMIAETQAGSSGPGKMGGFIPSLRAAFRYLAAERPETKGQKVACVGFCMGGGLSALLACEEPELAGAAVFYGSAPAPEKVAAIRCPVIAFYGGEDQRVNAGIPVFEEAHATSGVKASSTTSTTARTTPSSTTSARYDVRAARDSFARLLALLRRSTCRAEADRDRVVPRMPRHGQAGGAALQPRAAATATTWARTPALGREGTRDAWPCPRSSSSATSRKRLEASPGPSTHFEWHGGEPTLLGLDYFKSIVAHRAQAPSPGRKRASRTASRPTACS